MLINKLTALNNEYIERSRRADAKSALLGYHLLQERFRASNTSYATTLAGLGLDGSTSDGFYTVSVVVTPNSTTYQAIAIPGTSQANDSCGTFSIDESGPDDSGSYANVANCWNR